MRTHTCERSEAVCSGLSVRRRTARESCSTRSRIFCSKLSRSAGCPVPATIGILLSNYHSPGKRQRETNQARKKQEKAQERLDKRARGPKELPVVSASDLQGNVPSIEDAMRAIENPGSVERVASTISVRLFVGNLGDGVTEADLRGAFGAFGPISDAVIMVDRDTGSPRGFGFVTMSSRKDAAKTIESLNGSDLKGHSIVVNVATERGR